jgi:hypothetical protein
MAWQYSLYLWQKAIWPGLVSFMAISACDMAYVKQQTILPGLLSSLEHVHGLIYGWPHNMVVKHFDDIFYNYGRCSIAIMYNLTVAYLSWHVLMACYMYIATDMLLMLMVISMA